MPAPGNPVRSGPNCGNTTPCQFGAKKVDLPSEVCRTSNLRLPLRSPPFQDQHLSLIRPQNGITIPEWNNAPFPILLTVNREGKHDKDLHRRLKTCYNAISSHSQGYLCIGLPTVLISKPAVDKVKPRRLGFTTRGNARRLMKEMKDRRVHSAPRLFGV